MQTIIDEPDTKSAATFLFAHGAGAPMDSEFMAYFAKGLAEKCIRTVRFEFPYMQERRDTGKKRPPNAQKVLLESWQSVVTQTLENYSAQPLYVGGKSMGGRMASLLADEWFASDAISGLVCLGYPFHPPGKPDKLRVEHLEKLMSPTLILQGERDTMGCRDEIAGYALSSAIEVTFLPDGDHSLVPRKRSGFTQDGNWQQAIQRMVDFMTKDTTS